ncbi:MAG: class I SAM-dependent methyltransferase [Gemmatimonadaceae bacterium]
MARLAHPVIARTKGGARGLDYGCGQVPALGDLFTRSDRPTASYDPHFRPDSALLESRYDFLTCSEVIEHVHDPLPLLERFGALVHPGGIIGVMTRPYDTAGPFGAWWYRRDPTHVCFYSAQTMTWIGARFDWPVERVTPEVTIFSAV